MTYAPLNRVFAILAAYKKGAEMPMAVSWAASFRFQFRDLTIGTGNRDRSF